jgi:hypothetical protein
MTAPDGAACSVWRATMRREARGRRAHRASHARALLRGALRHRSAPGGSATAQAARPPRPRRAASCATKGRAAAGARAPAQVPMPSHAKGGCTARRHRGTVPQCHCADRSTVLAVTHGAPVARRALGSARGVSTGRRRARPARRRRPQTARTSPAAHRRARRRERSCAHAQADQTGRGATRRAGCGGGGIARPALAE